jgi:putative aldouronate transport system substrate-binding protein
MKHGKIKSAAVMLLVTAMALGGTVMALGGSAVKVAAGPSGDKEPITIKAITASHALNINIADMPMWQDLQEKTNINIEWDQVSSGWDEKKAVILASNDLPDLWLSGLTDSDHTMNMGAFLDLSGLIDSHGPNIARMFEEVPDTKKISTSSDGKIYSLPQVRPYRPNSFTVMMINQEWLDNLDLEIPATLEDLESTLIAFRDGDPNGNGINDEIPLDWNAGRASIFPITALAGAWGVAQDYSDAMVTVTDGVVDFVWATEAYKNLQIYLNRLYSQNLINQEVYTQDYSGMMAKSKQGDLAMVGVTLGWSIADRTGQFSDQYVALPPMTVTGGVDNPLWPSNPARVVYDVNKASIAASSEYPERIMELLDLIYSEYYSIQMYYGSIPNQVTNDEGTDTYVILNPPEGEFLDNVKWTNALVDNAPLYFSEALAEKTTAPLEETDRLNQDAVFAPHFPDEIYPIVKFDTDTIEELTFIQTDIYKVVDEKMASWVVNGNVDAEWDSYISQLEGMGLEQMREIYQQAYDDYYANEEE